jgi:AAA+ ATPase superfamily predicted ATPase
VAQKLIGRVAELRTLKERAKTTRGELVILWGRRRVGKTYLLQAFVEDARAVYYAATQQSAAVELAAFTDSVRQAIPGAALPPGYSFPDWTAALEAVTKLAGQARLIVVLDEFQYLSESTQGLESILQRWWDQQGRTSHVMLVLCGSSTSYMRDLTSVAAPLHQRTTATLHVRPMDFREAGQFFPKLSPGDRALAYGIVGGTPFYLDMWDADLSVKENIVALFGTAASPLVDAAELVLSGELPEAGGYFRILQAVALGQTKASEIQNYTSVAIERPLRRLTTLGYLARRVPALDSPAKSRRSTYEIEDPYFRFWFRFINTARSNIARGLGEQVVSERIMPQLDEHMGRIFEDMAREHARILCGQGRLKADRVDAWWSSDGQHEIDLVGVKGVRDVTFVGTAKWSARAMDARVLQNLEEHAAALPGVHPGIPRLIYARGGCQEKVASRPGVSCFSLSDMYS